VKVLLSWLREFVEIEAEPRRLADDLTRVGLAVDAVLPVGRDVLLDLDVTTNRVDCMNVYGLAREISVLYGKPLLPLETSIEESEADASSSLSVSVEAEDLCPRFCARVLDVRMDQAPEWIRDRLQAVGVRSVNNVVDLTNYVMLEMGHPSHAFDLRRIPEGRLVVRWAREGESVESLDGVERALSPRIGVVSGPEKPLALAGIMGGATSEVSEETRSVALEAAYWDPLSIRRAAKALGMHTEASHRFERGADPEGPLAATARIAHLLVKTGSGTTRRGLIDTRRAALGRRRARLRPRRATAVLGTEVSGEESKRILAGLGFGVEGDGEALFVEIPTWRGDVSREIDLVEEVGRHHGLDKVAPTLPAAAAPGGLRPRQQRERAVRDFLVGAGLTETVQHALVSASESRRLGVGGLVALANPLSEEQDVLRRSVVAPGLLGALRANARHGQRDAALFEIGRAFEPTEEAPRESLRLGLALGGPSRPRHWSEEAARPVDFFDAKGLVDGLLHHLGVRDASWRREGRPFLHPGRAAAVERHGRLVGYAGAIDAETAAAFDLRDDAVVAEIVLDDILDEVPAPERFRSLDRFPAVVRDLSTVCGATVPSESVLETIRRAGGSLLRTASLVTRYEGPPLAPGAVSLTFQLVFARGDATLTGEEVQGAMDAVVKALAATDVAIRGE
jgi:phenylalanyl-tRNA synthetase beta chain